MLEVPSPDGDVIRVLQLQLARHAAYFVVFDSKYRVVRGADAKQCVEQLEPPRELDRRTGDGVQPAGRRFAPLLQLDRQLERARHGRHARPQS